MNTISLLISMLLMLLGAGQASIRPNTGSGTTVGNLKVTQRNTARRNDLARLSAAITNYQTNNIGRTPMQQNPMPDAEQFIRQYLLGVNGKPEDFMDPDNIYYKVEFSNFDANKSYGQIDQMDYTIYVVGQASCDGEKVIAAEKARNYAISYKLEGDNVYCESY